MAFDRTQPYATVNTDAGNIYYLQSGIYYNSYNLSVAASPPAPVDGPGPSLPFSGLARKLNTVLTAGPPGNTTGLHGSGCISNTTPANSTNTISIKREMEADFDEVRIIIGGWEITNNSLAGIKAIVSTTETAAIDTADNSFRPIVGGTKFNAVRAASDLYGWNNLTWSKSSQWDGSVDPPKEVDLASSATGTLPLAKVDNTSNQRALDGPSSNTMASFLISDWAPCSSVPRADGGTRPLLLIRIYMPGDATHTWTWFGVPTSGSFQDGSAFQIQACRGRILQAAYSFSDNIAVLNDSFAFGAGTVKMPWFFVQVRSRQGGMTVMNVGDSITEDTYVADTVSSWGHRAACDASSITQPVQSINVGFSGQTSQQYWKLARNILTVIKPDVLTYIPFTQNDLARTRRTSFDQLAHTQDVLDYCQQNLIEPVLWTGSPVETLTPTQDLERRFVNTATIAMQPFVKVAEVNGLVSQGLASGSTDLFKPNDSQGNSYKANTTHPSEWSFENFYAPTFAGIYRNILKNIITGVPRQLDFRQRLVGTPTNDSARAGDVGEIISSTIAVGSGVSLTNNTAVNVTSISLTAGDWDVTGVVDVNLGATSTVSYLQGSVSTTSATLGPQDSGFSNPYAIAAGLGVDASEVLPTSRLSLAVTTTVYLVAQCGFAISTAKAYGTIRARRVR
jgi:hypothetical protein